MEGAKELPAETASRVRGTTVEVENLFYNVPARRKFMKSPRSEIQAIDTFIARMLIAQPAVKFVLTHNNTNVFSVPAGQEITDRIRYILGKDIAGRVVRATATDGKIGLDAYFTMPDMTFPNRKYQIFFVNRRLIKDRHIITAVDTSYRGLIPGGRYGLAILFIDISAAELDTNIHPAKTEIRFAAPHEIHSLIYRALRGTFSGGAAPETEIFSLSPQAHARDPREPQGMMPSFPQKKSGPPPVQTELPRPAPEPRIQPDGRAVVPEQQPIAPASSEPARPSAAAPFQRAAEQRIQDEITISGKQFRVLAQFFKTYILIELDGEPVYIDQHVASERIIYNELKRKTLRRPEQLQLISEPVEVPREVYNTLIESLETVKAAGVEIEPFGERAFIIRAVAHNVGPLDPAELLMALAHEISTAPHKTPAHVLTDKLLTVAACKMAVKAGQELTAEEMRSLIEAYMKEEFNRTCPHGRPIIHKVTRENLNAWFKR
jgi:DNA mismatch repair protein MutL